MADRGMADRGQPEAHRGQPEARGRAPGGTRRGLLKAGAALLAVPLLARLALPTSKAAAQDAIPGAPDLSGVTSKAAARRLVRQGRLVEISLFPTELGGPDDPENMAFVTPEAAAARVTVIGTLRRYVEQGLVDQLDVVPDYKGESIVPSRILITATHSRQDGEIALEIAVW